LLPLRKKVSGIVDGLKYSFVFWLVIALWSLSHPLVYGPIKINDQIFWLSYQLVGFLAFGAALGYIYKKRIRSAAETFKTKTA
jgi:hypothetical protein